MLFNSDVFLFVFLPLALISFYVLGAAGQTRSAIAALVLASLFYYGWWNPAYLPLILGSMLVNYVIGLGIQKQLREATSFARPLLVLGIIFNLGLLGYFKYANFFIENLNFVAGTSVTIGTIILPLAISFFTFQQIAYLVDVFQQKAREVDLLRYALFVTFFPQLIAGPIVHHTEMMPQFLSKQLARFQLRSLIAGLAVFFMGLFKKVVLADNVAPIANKVFNTTLKGESIGLADAWIGAFAYSCQIYFDFSGYSDMAIGLALMFGISLPLNFNSPYKATGIIDFWRRWHMTLSRFLRDYLYIPLGGNRLGASRRYINMMIVMLLGGLWHGASWNFVIWGGLHGTYLGINHAWRAWRPTDRTPGWAARAGGRGLTLLAVVIAFIFFRAETLESAVAVVAAMFTLDSSAASLNPADWLVSRDALFWVLGLLTIALIAPNTQQFMRDVLDRKYYSVSPPSSFLARLRWQPRPLYAFLTAVLTAITIMSLWQPSEFIYYQF